MGLLDLFKRKPKIEYEFINCHIDRSGCEDALDYLPKYENDTYKLKKSDFIKTAYEDELEYEYDYCCSNPKLVIENGKINAIVYGQTVGCIKKGSVSRIKKLINQNRIVDIKADIRGGKYKVYHTYYSTAEDKEITEYDTGENGFSVIFNLKILPDESGDKNEK